MLHDDCNPARAALYTARGAVHLSRNHGMPPMYGNKTAEPSKAKDRIREIDEQAAAPPSLNSHAAFIIIIIVGCCYV